MDSVLLSTEMDTLFFGSTAIVLGGKIRNNGELQVSPNPAKAGDLISFFLAVPNLRSVEVAIYDCVGNKLHEYQTDLCSEDQPVAQWNPTAPFSSVVVICKATLNDYSTAFYMKHLGYFR